MASLAHSNLRDTFYNDVFVLKTIATADGQPAVIDFSASGEIALECSLEHRSSFCTCGEGASQLGEILRKHGVYQVNNVWLDAATHATFVHVSRRYTSVGAR